MIRIRELYRLKNIRNLRLIAGEAGLERTLTAAVLFEYDPSRMQLPDFYRGDLVVTTLAYARGEEQLVAPSLLALMDQGIAALLVKTAYFAQLPQSVIAAADRLGTPIFLFDDTYIEEVILELTDLIRGKRRFAGFDKEIDALLSPGLDSARQRELLRLRYEENMTVTEIAAAIGRDKSTVSRTLSRARRRLYKCLRYGL